MISAAYVQSFLIKLLKGLKLVTFSICLPCMLYMYVLKIIIFFTTSITVVLRVELDQLLFFSLFAITMRFKNYYYNY